MNYEAIDTPLVCFTVYKQTVCSLSQICVIILIITVCVLLLSLYCYCLCTKYSEGTDENSLSIINVCNYSHYYCCLYVKYFVGTFEHSLFYNKCLLLFSVYCLLERRSELSFSVRVVSSRAVSTRKFHLLLFCFYFKFFPLKLQKNSWYFVPFWRVS